MTPEAEYLWQQPTEVRAKLCPSWVPQWALKVSGDVWGAILGDAGPLNLPVKFPVTQTPSAHIPFQVPVCFCKLRFLKASYES